MPKKCYASYNPIFVYTQEYHQTTLDEAINQNQQQLDIWAARHSMHGCIYKTKTTKAGRMLEVEIYPSFLHRKDYSRTIKEHRTGEAQKKQNTKNAQRKLVRMVHSNFAVGDIFFTGGFSDSTQPASDDDCKKFIANYLARLKYSCKNAGGGKIKYIYVIERSERRDGTVKYHVHIIMSKNAGLNSAGVDGRDWIESKWTGGDYANTKSLQWKQDGGFTGISRYFTKQFEDLQATERFGSRRWGQSLGLIDCTETPKEDYSRFKKRRVSKLVRNEAEIKAEFEREFPGYKYLDDYPCEIRYSEVVSGFYLYCRMYRRN